MHTGFVGFENAWLTSSYRYLIKFISMQVTVNDVSFCDCLERVYVKYKKRASTTSEMPD